MEAQFAPSVMETGTAALHCGICRCCRMPLALLDSVKGYCGRPFLWGVEKYVLVCCARVQ